MPELPFIITGLLGSLGFGFASPWFSSAYIRMVEILSETDVERARLESQWSALELGGVGLLFLVATVIQGKYFQVINLQTKYFRIHVLILWIKAGGACEEADV